MGSGDGRKGELFTEGSTDVDLFILGDVTEEQAIGSYQRYCGA